MAWNLDDDVENRGEISSHLAATMFLRRSVAVVREVTGLELDFPEFGINCLEAMGIISHHWDYIPSAKSHPDTVVNYCVAIAVMDWVESCRKNSSDVKIEWVPLSHKKTDALFPLLVELVGQLFPRLKLFPDYKDLVNDSFKNSIRQAEQSQSQWRRGYAEKMICLRAICPCIRQWGLNDERMGKIAGEINPLNRRARD